MILTREPRTNDVLTHHEFVAWAWGWTVGESIERRERYRTFRVHKMVRMPDGIAVTGVHYQGKNRYVVVDAKRFANWGRDLRAAYAYLQLRSKGK